MSEASTEATMTATRTATATAAPADQGPDPQQLGEQIRQDVQRALQAAEQARADAARAALEAQGIERGDAFRVDEQGNIVPLDAPGAPTAIATQPPPLPPFVQQGPPPEVVAIAIAFFVMIAVIVVGLPLARAVARRMDRQAAPPSPLAAEQAERIARIEHAVDAMAIEVERISEGQRFVTKLLTERALPEGAGTAAAGVQRPDPLPVGGERR